MTTSASTTASTSASTSYTTPPASREGFCGFEMGTAIGTSGLSGTCEITTAEAKTGVRSLLVNPTDGNTGFIRVAGLSSVGHYDEVTIGSMYGKFDFKHKLLPEENTDGVVESMIGGIRYVSGLKMSVTIGSDAKLRVRDAYGNLVSTGTTVLSSDTWYRINMLATTTIGTSPYALLIDGVTELSGECSQLTQACKSLSLGREIYELNGDVEFYYDNASVDGAWHPGDTGVLGLFTTGNGTHTDWANDYANIDEIPMVSSGDNIESDSGGRESVTHDALATGTDDEYFGEIYGIIVHSYVRHTLFGTILTGLLSDSTIEETTAEGLTGTHGHSKAFWHDPDSKQPWTIAGANACEATVYSAGGTNRYCYALNMEVEFGHDQPDLATTTSASTTQSTSASTSATVSSASTSASSTQSTSASTSGSTTQSTTASTTQSTTASTSASTSATVSSASTSASTSATVSSASTSASTSATVSSASTSASTTLTDSTASTSGTTSATVSSASTSASTTATVSSASTSASTTQTDTSFSTSASTTLTVSTLSTSATSSLTTTNPPVYVPEEFGQNINMLALNNAGTSQRNPIISGIHFRITYHKHDQFETLSSMWVTVDGNVFSTLTAGCIETDYLIYCDVEAGVDLKTGHPSVLNIINVTTSYDPVVSDPLADETFYNLGPPKIITVQSGIYVSDEPDAMILLDGYNAPDVSQPAVMRPYG